MSGPWEKYQQPQKGGPWERYAAPKADFSDVTAAVDSTESRPSPEANNSNFARMISGKPREKGNAVTRALGKVGGRQVLQGAYGLYGALGGDALDHYILSPIDRALGTEGTNFQLGTGGRGYRQTASEFADSLGMAKPQTAGERVISDVGEGLTGTALTLGLGSGLSSVARAGGAPANSTIAGRVGNFLTAQPALQAASTATGTGASSVARESGAGQGAQLAAGLIGGLAPGVGAYSTAAAVRGAVRGRSGAAMRGNFADFASLGATPSVGQASQRRWVQGLEGLLSKAPTSSGVISRFAEQQADDVGRNLQNKAEGLSAGAGSENAGLSIERGMQSFKADTTAVKKALYWAVDKQIPASTATSMVNTRRTLARLTTPDPAAPATTSAMVQPRIAKLRQNLDADLQANGGNLPYEALKRIRTEIGEAIDGSSPLNPRSDLRELNALYGALSQDMMAAAQAQGPAAVKAALRANNYTRNVANRMELVQRVLDKNGGPEKVFQAAMAGTNDGATTLRGVMYSLPKEEQKAVSAAVIKRMGLATAGNQGAAGDVFSAATFLTNWNKISPEAKRVLFGRYGTGFSKDMDRIASVANNIKQGSKVYSNPSGTGNLSAAIGYWVGLLGSIATGNLSTAGALAVGGASANIVANAMTNPQFVRWLASSTALPKGSAVAQLQALRMAAERNGNSDLATVAAALQQADNQPDSSRN